MKHFFQKIFGQKTEINYLYFSALLLFLSFLSFYLNREPNWEGIPLFFLFYAIGQSLLEVGIFILIAYLLLRWAPRWLFLFFIGLSFVLMLLHYTHFIMVRLMDATLGYIFKFFFYSGIDHLIAGFYSLNMNGAMVALVTGTFAAIPLIGLAFYWLTSYASRHKPLYLSLRQILVALGGIGLTLFFLDLVAHPFLDRYIYSKYQKRLPLGTTFIEPKRHQILLPAPLAPNRQEQQSAPPELQLLHRPNIYLFVIETLRRDYIDEKIAPHLSQFGKEHIQFRHSFANANSTHLSWVSIFHADLPLDWTVRRDSWQEGSFPLRFLKKLGYQVKIYSSVDLCYYNMDHLLFGQKRKLADAVEEYSQDRSLEPWQRDALAFTSLKRDLSAEGNVFILFLDATHSEYSFPNQQELPFTPIAQEIDYLALTPKSPELNLIKNRYRNAIHYVDHLIGDFFAHLKKVNLFEDAIIALTADHGEEFFEEGALFHGTHLNSYQTSVPLFFKFPSPDWIPQTQLATHIDIFPSILHYLTKQSDFSSYFDGQSIFSLNHTESKVAVLHNGAAPPLEFTVDNPLFSVNAQIVDGNQVEILQSKGPFTPEDLLFRKLKPD